MRSLQARHLRKSNGGVFFEGSLETAYRANLWLRCAQRILWPIKDFACSSYDELYAGARELRWIELIRPTDTIAVDCVSSKSPLAHGHHAALRIKDAIVDQMRELGVGRPNVNVSDPDVRVFAYIHGTNCQLSIDLSGEPLFKRKYRRRNTEAPLKETLAAGLVALSRWRARSPLIDPMCGSGTLLIEAALLALERAPGRQRSFGFQRHLNFGDAEARAFGRLLEEADECARARLDVEMLACDRDPEALEAARQNARAAGVADSITFTQADVRELDIESRGGTLISNPPYGKRLGGSSRSVEALYRQVGQKLRAWSLESAWLLSSSPSFERCLALPPSHRYRLYNGNIETWLYGYQLETAGVRRRGGRPGRKRS